MKRIGEILIEHGSLTKEQLSKALDRQKSEPSKLLGALLIEMGFVGEEDIVIALATQFNFPYLTIGNFSFDETAVKLIPKELMQKYICVPLEKIGNLLTVVMADPTNEEAIHEIETATGCKVQPFVASVTEIAAVIQKHFQVTVAPSSKSGDSLSQASFRSAVKQKTEDKTTQQK